MFLLENLLFDLAIVLRYLAGVGVKETLEFISTEDLFEGGQDLAEIRQDMVSLNLQRFSPSLFQV